MDSIVEAKLKGYLRNRLGCDPYQCGSILFNVRKLARNAGHALDHRFANAGLSAGPEARVASSIVDHALGGGSGSSTSPYEMKKMIDRWMRTTAPKGR